MTRRSSILRRSGGSTASASSPGGGAGRSAPRHDVARSDPPDEAFDLVHARLVPVHVADREHALRSMIAALKPGGRLLRPEPRAAMRACRSSGGLTAASTPVSRSSVR
ncbi:class I SAM-dependent methyltransferase [Nonomuraea sp. NPDC052116]|uniref:class I SAM-dependent methyltransferase n=1 Tax=Nonomuraea sp. NPDC052116 TaxID=3155665 RepID=UPI00343CF4BE